MFIEFSYFSIVRAFLIEEQRIVAMVMKSKKPTGATEAVTTTTTQQTGQKSKQKKSFVWQLLFVFDLTSLL